MSDDSPEEVQEQTDSPVDGDGEQPQDQNEGQHEDHESPDSEDPFPEDTPTAIQQKVSAFQNRLRELGVEVHSLSHQNAPITDEEGEPTGDEELDSVALQCQYDGSPFFVVFPIDEPFVIFQSDYDVLEDMVYSSDDPHLGGPFQQLDPDVQWKRHQQVRQNLEMEQVLGLCQANRNIPIPTLDAWLSLVRTSSDRFTVETTRIQFEYIAAIAQRRVYTSPTELSSQDLYDTVSQLLSIRQALQEILGGAYILDGITIPEDFESLHQDVEEDPRQSQPFPKGYQ